MGAVHGKNTCFKLDNSGGTLQDLSTYCDSVGFPRELEEVETTTFGSAYKQFITGFQGAEITIGGKWDPTLDAHMAGIFGQANTVTFEYGPQGSTATNVKYTGEAVLTKYEQQGGVGDAVTWSATIRCTGTITRTTF